MTVGSVFSRATGEFTGTTVTVSSSALLPGPESPVGVMPGVFSKQAWRVDVMTGEVVAWQSPSPPDTELVTWCWHEAGECWVAEPTLAAYHVAAWSRIKAERDVAKGKAIAACGHSFDAGPASRAAVAQKALAAHVAWTAGSGGEWSVEWTTASNEVVSLGAREVINLALALDQRDQAEHALSQALRGAIAAATCKADLDAIGWPTEAC